MRTGFKTIVFVVDFISHQDPEDIKYFNATNIAKLNMSFSIMKESF